MKLFKQILALLLILLLFAGFNGGLYIIVTGRCATNFGSAFQAKAIQPEKYLPFDEDSLIVKQDASLKLTGDLPVLDGATALLPVYSAVANALYPAESCQFDGESFTAESSIQYRNTVGSYKAIVDGEADIIFCAAPSKEQLAYAEEKGVKLKLVPIGYEAFVFFVNAQNPIEALTQEQIRSIYAGQITDWSEVGGPRRSINPVTRVAGSGSQSAMLRFMGGAKMSKSPLAFLGGSIGYSYRYYLDGIVGEEGVKMLSVDSVYPSAENIRNGSYPIINNFYAVYRADDPNKNIGLLIDWLLSEEGQQIINQSGYVGIK